MEPSWEQQIRKLYEEIFGRPDEVGDLTATETALAEARRAVADVTASDAAEEAA